MDRNGYQVENDNTVCTTPDALFRHLTEKYERVFLIYYNFVNRGKSNEDCESRAFNIENVKKMFDNNIDDSILVSVHPSSMIELKKITIL